MSVNSGGFFFSNPTSTNLPDDTEDEKINAMSSGIAASLDNNGYNVGAGVPCNFNAQGGGSVISQQPIMNNNNMNVNNLNQGNFLMNNNSANIHSNINTGNLAANTMGNMINTITPTNIYDNQNIGMVNNPLSNNNNNGSVQNTNTGFGSFFFNPLNLFTNNSNTTVAPNNMTTNTILNYNTLGVNNPILANNNSMNTNAILNNNNLDAMPNNIITTNTIMNNNALGVYQQNPTMQMQVTAATGTTSLPALSTNPQYATSVTPMPMAFLTPNQGPTPCSTPPGISIPPMFLDAISFQPEDVDACVNNDSNSSIAPPGFQQVAVPQETNTVPIMIQGTQEAPSPALALPSSSTSLLRRGISSIMGTALGAVATYVNQSFLSGIPFHIADRAMKESKETYAKWWEDGINNADNEKKRKGSTDEEDRMDDDEQDASGNNNGRPAEKKRKLDSSESTGGSALSVSLKKHYDQMGIDTSSKFIENQQQLQSQLLPPSQHANNMDVDSSIIKPRRGQFERKKAPPKQAETANKADGSSGYNAFNNIGGMYDFGVENGSDGENESDGGAADGDIDQSLTYDSLGSYYATNNEGSNNANEASTTATAPLNSNATTIPSNITALDGTMQVIQELFEEKNRASEENEMLQMIRSPRDWVTKSIRSELVDALQMVQGDVTDKRFLSSLEILSNFYKTSGRDARVSPWSGRRRSDPGIDGGSYGYSGSEIGGPTSSDLLEGNWVNMSRPNYVECLGENGENEFMYTLGRMSFDMFQPGGLICSVQSTHSTIKIIGEREELPAFVPKSLKEEVASLCDSGGGDGAAKRPLLRSYDIAVSLTIEPPSSVGQPKPPATPTPTKRMRALMTVKGYVLPDPEIPNRLTVWFTGGKLSPARLSSGDGAETDDEDQAEYHQPVSKTEAESDGYGGFEDWTAMFAKGKWRKTLGERARAMAAKLLLGADVPNKMEEDGHMEYVLHRPVGSHGKVYIDVLYLDDDILIMRGHHGTIYALARSGVSQRYRAMRGNLPSNTDA
mmetsp:Transcript_14781/g.32119  ORF Transcript_14781/g.32119 Transcript_14781/m.32119 type:complete len:1020 (-) Transcript_14781:267-3326(-)